MKVYSIDLRICGTLYVRADNEREAMKIARATKLDGLELIEQDGEIPISGRDYSSPDLPDVSLSPAMTVWGPWRGARPDLVHDDREDKR